MTYPRCQSSLAFQVTIVLLVCAPIWSSDANAAGHWRTWGGPSGDFIVRSGDLADTWPSQGPPLLWKQPLGDGYSSIAFDDGRLFTMYRDGGDEVVVGVDAATGSRIWEHRYAAPLSPELVREYGVGPRAMPIVVGDLVYTVGINSEFIALHKARGERVWSTNLVDDHGGTFLRFGYSAPPIHFEDTMIAVVGGTGHALIAFDLKTGAVRWKAFDYKSSHASPGLIDVDGEVQLVAYMEKDVIGVDPLNGELKWSVRHENPWGTHCVTPLLGDDNLLFITTEAEGGLGVRLTRDAERTRLTRVWKERDPLSIYYNVLRLGDVVYGSFGGSLAPFTAVNVRNGKSMWKDRAITRAQLLYADRKIIYLEANGTLGLATVSPLGISVSSKAVLFGHRSWAIPSLVDTTLYVRDLESIYALDLGKQ